MRDDYAHLVGHRFPGGQTIVPRWMNHLWADAVLADDPLLTRPEEARDAGHPDAVVHPVLVYFAAIQGSGVEFQDIFELMDAAADSGVLFGEEQLEFTEPLYVERPYEVEGEIVDVVRKEGKRAGVFDMLTFVLRLREPEAEEPVASSTSVFIFPRKENE